MDHKFSVRFLAIIHVEHVFSKFQFIPILTVAEIRNDSQLFILLTRGFTAILQRPSIHKPVNFHAARFQQVAAPL